MFNSKYKKEALTSLKQANEKYQCAYNETIKEANSLYDNRKSAVSVIKDVEIFINLLANKPKELEKCISDVNINYKKFESQELEIEGKKVEHISGSIAGSGVMAGVGVAALGPTAAMAVATTFGTASTGTAIATLSGAAATNAALAWLGGGALAVGGGGMVAGEALLALAGPIGWGIGGVALLGGGLLASSKNKNIAEKAEKETRKIKIETKKITEIKIKVNYLVKETKELVYNIINFLDRVRKYRIWNYEYFNDQQKEELKILLNSTKSLSSKICEKIN